jgi:hypothetical protein
MSIPVPNTDLVAKVGDPANYDFEGCETRLDPMGPYNPVDVVAAIMMTAGNFAKMAVLLGRNRTRVRDFVLRKPEVKLVYDEVKESILDDIEESVIMSALNGDPADRRFVLTTLGKHRGFTTRVENTGVDGAPMQVIDPSVLSGKSNEEIKEAIRALQMVTSG